MTDQPSPGAEPGPDAEADAEAEPRPLPHGPRRPSRWWHTPRGAVRLLVALVVLVLGLVVALVGVTTADDRPRVAVGAVVDHPYAEDPLPHAGEVLLPWARLQVAAGEPRAELPDLLGGEPNVQAPAGGRFVRVEITLPDDYQVPLAAQRAPFEGEAEVVLRADGRDYPLTGPEGFDLGADSQVGQLTSGSRWVAVDGEPGDLEVRVTVDGVTQVVDASDGSVDAGPAAALAEIPTVEELAEAEPTRCGPAERIDDSDLQVDYPDRLDCSLKLVLRVPYVDGLGWAPEGREYLIVHETARPFSLDLTSVVNGRTGYWDNREIDVGASLGGEPELSSASVNSLNQGTFAVSVVDDPVQHVFEVPADEPLGDLRLTLTVDAELGAPFVTDRQRLEVRWTVPGEELT